MQVVIDAGPRNHLYLLGQQVKIRSSPRNHLYLQPRSARCGVFALRGNRKDSSKIALNVDLHLALNRRQHDLIHQRANCVGCLYPLALFFILKRLVELLDALAILQRHARV
ncbi:hypothetical protein [Rhodopseudomonas faecalis]|uniref:hypothetical protein n=1 Tax=Rhodopseudomonas faecalis TaxID=99655 RepID=UPI001FE1A0FD|nr:hypothetical protein [Rhodopseudomonas faecalis]